MMNLCRVYVALSSVMCSMASADIERIPLDKAAYKVVEDIRDYSQLGGLKKEQDRVQQQI